jgi:hypothetical protein
MISEFQQALIGAGITLVAGVWTYNRWQEYRYRKAAEQIFRGTQADALIDEPATDADSKVTATARHSGMTAGERVEPGISAVDDVQAEVTVGGDASLTREIGVDAAESVQVTEPLVEGPGEDCIDSLIEVGLPLSPALTVAVLHAAWQEQRVQSHKRLRWIGRASDDWVEILDPSVNRATRAYITIQLADRQGPIGRDELSAFCTAVNAVLVAQGGQPTSPALDEIIAHANALDELCASVDIQIAIHIVGKGGQAFAGSKLRGLLEASGLQLAPDGLFYLLDANGARLLSVCNSGAVPFDLEQMRTGTTSDVTLWLDVPRVADGGNVFDIMLATARQLAGALDGVLVDDQRNPLADNVLVGIRAKVLELQAQMAARGIPAGGRRALRLFA